MKLLIQFGKKGDSLADHLITPIARAKNIDEIIMVCRRRGPDINKVRYYATPRLLAKIPSLAVIYEFFVLLLLSIFKHPDFIGGYHLFPHTVSAFIAAKLTGKPVIASLIGGKYELYSQGSIERCNLHEPPRWRGSFLLALLRKSNIITTTGKVTKEFLVGYGIDEKKIYPIINPPNEMIFYREEMPKTYDLISVARLVKIKHIEVLLYAISEAKRSYPDIKACVLGDGPSRKILIKLANALGIENNVDFEGFQKDVAHYYNRSRVFIHTSEREGFPNVFLEAGMCGLPGIVSACGDIVDVAEDGYNCFVIPDYNDSKAFAEAIVKLMTDENLRERMSENTIKSVQAISRKKITETWEEIFDNLARPTLN
jgi:glycosyltransferase involved in cell wall biosynthesis